MRAVSVNAGLRSACGWVRLTDKQSTMKDSGIDRVTYVLWRCTEGVQKQGVIHVFDPIQSVQATNTVMLRYTRISQKIGASTLASLSTAKPLSTCNYTSNNGRWMRGLEILPTAHARTHTHKHTATAILPTAHPRGLMRIPSASAVTEQ